MKKLAIILLCALISTAALADRPKVGVVLCGGGAKGAAHVGVLKVLEENGIPVDYIAGTSMGAIIGGLYSIGYSADELKELILTQNWDMVMSDRISRRDLSFEQKKGRDKYIITIPFGLGDYSRLSSWKERRTLQDQSFLSTIPMAIVSGQNIYNLFTKLSVGYQDSLDFNRMPIPFACVAVDLISKKEVVFHSGNFVDAIRSSMAIPGYFAPVKMGDMVLIDGGSLNNYPVDVVKEMGADIVIGVLLGGDEQKVPKIDNIGDIANEMMDMYLDVKKADNVNSTDILITPSVRGYNVLSFDTESLDSLMVNGEKAAREKEDEIRSLKAMLDREDRIRAETFVGPEMKKVRKYAKAIHLDKDTVTIRSISVKGLDGKEVSTMLRKTDFKPGSRLTGSAIEDQIDKFYNTGAFESVTYALRGTEEPYDLDLNFVRGRNSSFSAGFRFDSEEIAAIILNVGLNNRSFSGHRIDLTAKLAYNFQAQATYSYGFQSKTQFNFSYKFRSSDLNMFKQDYLSSFIFNEHSVIANFSTQRTRYWHSDIGGRIDAFQYRSVLSSGQEPLPYDLDPDRKFFLRAYANLSFDSMDKVYFPTEGLKFEIEANYITDKLFNSELKHPGFVTANLNLSGIIPCGSRVAIIPALSHRSMFGSQIPCAYANLMGGFEPGRYADHQMTFIGFTYAHLFETNLSTLTLDTRVRIMENHYVFASGACAFDYHQFSDIMQNKPAMGFRLGYAYDSFAGPLALNLTWSDFTKKFGAYVSIGYSF